MGKINKTPNFLKMNEQLQKDLVSYASVEGVNFIQDNFQKQGFTDAYFVPWLKRLDDVDPGRKILVKSSFLLNSIQVFDANNQRIVFGSDAEYAKLHNEGGTLKIPVTERSRKYFWLMYKVTQNSKWKAMALTKKQVFTITIPKRQFLGESETFNNNLDSWIIDEILKRFKQL